MTWLTTSRYAFDFDNLDFLQRNRLLIEARQTLLFFYNNLEDRLKYPNESTAKSAIFFQMSYQMSLLLIHRPFLREDNQSTSFRLALRSMTGAASVMVRVIQIYRKSHKFQDAPPHVAHHILTASITHLLNTTSSTERLRRQSVGRFRICVQALEDMQMTWKRARRAIQMLQELAKRWNVVSALPMHLSHPIGAERAEMFAASYPRHTGLEAVSPELDFEPTLLTSPHNFDPAQPWEFGTTAIDEVSDGFIAPYALDDMNNYEDSCFDWLFSS